MIPLHSSIEGFQSAFKEMNQILNNEGFSLGGGYKYDHGYFDHPLDWEEDHGYRYYLRIPAYAQNGDLDQPETKVKLGRPFVIKHEFLTGNDPTSNSGFLTGTISQFSKPIPAEDHHISQHWINRAQSLLRQLEQKLTPKN
ncbi:YugN family protein [Thermoflavimicrobium dichotomicum]|uniref:YugN-like family protein n=1 Tax=Thermoflavimicrobium dichotomicum TaxID=46223 RepID=A0A1I3MDD3_9BACL|nr:YugN family protein [Thermoflavimicrobium dichotomicum]SFI94978.1 YugN-like family protein [Thermoflavimicrobium dichotomicum]